MIDRELLDLGLVAYCEAGSTSMGAQMAGVDPTALQEWAHDATGPEFLTTVEEEMSDHSIRAGLIAAGVLVGINVTRPR